MSWKQRLQFFSRFVVNPKQIGSVTPSSRFLVEAMLKYISWKHIDTLVELGAGTGTFTKQIQLRMKNNCQSFIFEQDPLLYQRLKQQYPNMIHCTNAQLLQHELMKRRVSQVDCIISSLPFANFTDREREVYIHEIKQVLANNGIFIAYQYSLQMKKVFQQHFREVNTRFVPINLPPCFIYVCR